LRGFSDTLSYENIYKKEISWNREYFPTFDSITG